jgi:PleD family two-component response regulator
VSGSSIAVVGGTPTERDRIVAALADHDLEAEAHHSLQLDVVTNLPSLVIVVGPDPDVLCAAARAAPPLVDVPILVLTEDQDKALAAGATDIATPILTDLALARRVRNMQTLGRLRGPWNRRVLGKCKPGRAERCL